MNSEVKKFMEDMGFHDGYHGMFSRGQAEGALANGTRIRKRNSEPGDSTPDGTYGVILGSINRVLAGVKDHPDAPDVTFLYFVEWYDKPGVAVGTIDLKVEAV